MTAFLIVFNDGDGEWPRLDFACDYESAKRRLDYEVEKGWMDSYEFRERDTISPSRLGQLLDMEAENANYHSMVGVHEWLADIILGIAGEETTANIMWEIADMGGLHDFNG